MTLNNNIYPFYITKSDEERHTLDKSNVFFWNGYEKKEGCVYISKYLENNADRIRKKYVEFVHDLSTRKISNKNLPENLKIDENYNLWSMSLINEKSHYKSPKIKDCLKLIAVEEIIKSNKPTEIILFEFDDLVTKALKTLTKNLNIKLIIKKTSITKKKIKYKSMLHLIYHKCPIFIQAFIYLTKHFILYWPLRRSKKVECFSNKNIFFLSYMFHLDLESYKKGEFKTNQWGPLPDMLKKISSKTNWMHHFVNNPIISNPKIGVNFVNKLNENNHKNETHQFLLSYLNISILLKVIFNYLKILIRFSKVIKFKSKFNPTKSNLSLWSLMKIDFLNSIIGPKSIENLMWIEIFDNVLKKIPHQEKGIYTQENQGWENAFIAAWKKNKHGQLYALNNGFVRFWDIRFISDQRIFDNFSEFEKIFPDHIILTEQLSWNHYIKMGFPEKKLVKAETVRYFDLCLNVKNPDSNYVNENKNESNALILGDMIFDPTNNMIKTIEKTKYSKNFNWTFKSHPGCPINLDKFNKIKINTTDKNLVDIISNFSLVIAPSATLSVLEAYLQNIKVIIYLDSEEINLSPLRRFPNIHIVSNVDEMNHSIDPRNKIVNVEKNQDLFWFDKNLTMWKKIIS